MSYSKKRIILIIFFLVSFLVVVFLIILPLIKEIKIKSEEFLQEKQVLTQLKIKTENLKKAQTLYTEYQSKFEKIKSLFIDPREPINFVEFLERESNNSNLSIGMSINPAKEIKGDPWPSMNFQLTLKGTFPNFLEFLEKLESAPYLIEFQNLNIRKLSEKESQEEGISEGGIVATLLLKVYTKEIK